MEDNADFLNRASTAEKKSTFRKKKLTSKPSQRMASIRDLTAPKQGSSRNLTGNEVRQLKDRIVQRDKEIEELSRWFIKDNICTAEELEKYKRVFVLYDEDGSGDISFLELQRMMEKLGTPKNPLELRKLIQEVDSTGSGSINFQDFVTMMIKHTPSSRGSASNRSYETLPATKPKKATLRKETRRTATVKLLSGALGNMAHGEVKHQAKHAKLAFDIMKTTPYDQEYIEKILQYVFEPIYMESNSHVIRLDQFLHVFQGKMGTADTVKKMFAVFDVNNSGYLTPEEFCNGIARIDSGSDDSRLRFFFALYDDDESHTLERNELALMMDHVEFLARYEGRDLTGIAAYREQVMNDFAGGSDHIIIDENKFVEIGLKHKLLTHLTPLYLFHFEHWTDLFSHVLLETPSFNAETSELLSLLKSNAAEAACIKLVKTGKIDPYACDLNGLVITHFIITRNKFDALKEMFGGFSPEERSKVINFTYKGGMTLLHAAAEKGNEEIIKFLVNQGAPLDVQDDQGWTPLHRAMRAERNSIGGEVCVGLETLVALGANVKIEDKDGCTVLDIGARYDEAEHFDVLYEHGADIHHISHGGLTALHWAANTGSIGALRWLLSKGADVNKRTSAGLTPLHLAAGAGRMNCVERLLQEPNIDIVAVDDLDRTVLHMTAAEGNVRVVRMLLFQAPAMIKMKNKAGDTPLEAALKAGNPVAAKIIAAGPLTEQSEFSINLLTAFRRGDNSTVLKMLHQNQADVHAANENGTTLLHYAAMQGRDDILELLLSKGANPNIGNNRSTTPLHKAVQRGELKCVKALLNAGAKTNVQDEDYMTPLTRGIHELHKPGKKTKPENTAEIFECIKEIVTRGAKLMLVDAQGLTALSLAARFGLTDLVEFLVGKGADLTNRSKNGYSALHWAAEAGHQTTFEKLVQLGANVNDVTAVQDFDPSFAGSSVLHLAIHNTHSNMTEFLLTNWWVNMNCSIADAQGKLPLHVAALVGSPYFGKLLEKAPDQATAVDKAGNTPLHYAGAPHVIQLLTAHHADVNARNNNGETPLLRSSFAVGSVSVLEALLTAGADLQVKANDGSSALYQAARGRHMECIKFLAAKGLAFEEPPQSTETIVIEAPDQDYVYPRVMASTLPAMIERVAYPKFLDPRFAYAVFLCYRNYESAETVLQQLLELADKQPLLFNFRDVHIEEFAPEPGALAALHFWVTRFPQDFEHGQMAETVLQYFNNNKAKLGKYAAVFTALLTDRIDNSVKNVTARRDRRRTVRESQMYVPKAFSLWKTPLQTIAEQWTTLEAMQFQQIPVKEFFGQAWNKKTTQRLSPTIMTVIRQFNQFASWVATEVLRPQKAKDRAKVLTDMIGVAKHCSDMNNFQAVMEIITGLESSPVSRLSKTWAKLDKKTEQTYTDIKATLKFDKNYKAYRAQLDQLIATKQPCIPFLGLFLSDLTFLDEGYDETVTHNGVEMINVERLIRFSEIVQKLRACQQIASYPFKDVPDLFIYLQQLPGTIENENERYQLSLKVEPRAS